MTRLPCIVGFGGANAAGLTSSNHAYNRMVLEALTPPERQRTLECLAAMMNLISDSDEGIIDREGNHLELSDIESRFGEEIINGTMIRRIEENHFDPDATHWQQKVPVAPNEGGVISFITSARNVPVPLPQGWKVSKIDDKQVRVDISDKTEFKVDAYRDFAVKSAGQLPTGFNPGEYHNDRFQPTNLKLSVFAASDALHHMGIPWEIIMEHVNPEDVSAYGGTAFNMQKDGFGSIMQNRLMGDRVSTKSLAMGIPSMPVDFINAYVLGNVGQTNCSIAACATFLYNLRIAVEDIQAGRSRVAMVMNCDTPIIPEIMDGFATMGALATEENLKKIDGTDSVDPRTVSRPFGDNCGFTIGESGQAFILMDDALALELGADIYAAVPSVFVAADGHKKSITGPGPGNYLTLARAVSAAQDIIGKEGLNRSFIQAHGSSTPQNRVTESHIFHTVAETFGIKKWPVSAVKAFVGHTISAASADQLSSTLGVFSRGIIPGIPTIEKAADDVFDEHLVITKEHKDVGVGAMDAAFLNSKGFGGANATAVVLAPHIVEDMIAKRYDAETIAAWQTKREATRKTSKAYDDEAVRGNFNTIYRFGENMIDESEMEFSETGVKIPGFNEYNLVTPSLYSDMK